MRQDWEQLGELADEDRAEEVLQLVSLDDVADTWVAYHRREDHGDDDPDWWAVSLWLARTWWNDEKRIQDGLERLIARADGDRDLLQIIGAGPLEAFLDRVAWEMGCGNDSRLRWLEEKARTDEAWRESLRGAWPWPGQPDAMWARLDAVLGSVVTDRHPRR